MNRRVRLIVSCLAAVPFVGAISVAGAAKPDPKAGAFAKVDAILKPKCLGCHNGAAGAGGVNLSSYATITKGKFKGKPLVVPKNAKASVLAKALHGTGVQKMPPGGALPPAETKVIEAWITAGAKP